MAARLAMLAPRFIALVVIWLLAWASFSLAQGSGQTTPPPAPVAVEAEKPVVLVVPDVRRQAYVFAKGILQDAGFAWRVRGAVDGFAANTVTVQTPAPGARVIDNGAPVVTIRLARSAAVRRARRPGEQRAVRRIEGRPPQELAGRAEGECAARRRGPRRDRACDDDAGSDHDRAGRDHPRPGDHRADHHGSGSRSTAAQDPAYRKPDFTVSGAPGEPTAEMPLPARPARSRSGPPS